MNMKKLVVAITGLVVLISTLAVTRAQASEAAGRTADVVDQCYQIIDLAAQEVGSRGRFDSDSPARGQTVFERWVSSDYNGWFYCMDQGEETIELYAQGLEKTPEDTVVVMIPLSSHSALMVESLRNAGDNGGVDKEGALIYRVDIPTDGRQATIRSFPAYEDDPKRERAPRAEGESATYCNITITNMAAYDEGDDVKVSIPDSGVECDSTDTASAAMGGYEINTCDTANIPDPQNPYPIMLRIYNNSDQPVTYAWLDVDTGDLYQPQTLAPGEGENWSYNWEKPVVMPVVLDENNEVVARYDVTNDPKQCISIEGSPQSAQVDLPTVQLDADGCPVFQGTGDGKVICYPIEGATIDELLESHKKAAQQLGIKRVGELISFQDLSGRKGSFEYNWGWDLINNEYVCNKENTVVNYIGYDVYVGLWNPPANASPDLVAKYNAYFNDRLIGIQYLFDLHTDSFVQILRNALIAAPTCDFKDPATDSLIQNAFSEMVAIFEEAKKSLSLMTEPEFFDNP